MAKGKVLVHYFPNNRRGPKIESSKHLVLYPIEFEKILQEDLEIFTPNLKDRNKRWIFPGTGGNSNH